MTSSYRRLVGYSGMLAGLAASTLVQADPAGRQAWYGDLHLHTS